MMVSSACTDVAAAGRLGEGSRLVDEGRHKGYLPCTRLVTQ
jgi:hypothetical protein